MRGRSLVLLDKDGTLVADVPHSADPSRLRLAPGAGARLTIRMRRHVNDPTLHFPWHATVADRGDIPVLTGAAAAH